MPDNRVLSNIASNIECIRRLFDEKTKSIDESLKKIISGEDVKSLTDTVLEKIDEQTNNIKTLNENGEPIIFATQRGYGEFKGGWEFPGGKIEDGETPQEALVREIREELETEIAVGKLIDTIEYDYPTFHLSMDCFWAEIVSGDLVLKEHEAAKWLKKDELDSVEWLPADITLVGKVQLEL